MKGNRPAEIFGYSITDQFRKIQDARKEYWCRFRNNICIKRSDLSDYPFGICTVEHLGQIYAACPCRFEEKKTIDGIPRVLEDVALHYFGDFNNIVVFHDVTLPNTGVINHLLIRHKPLKAEVDDFVAIQIQTDATIGDKNLNQSMIDFLKGHDIQLRPHDFDMDTDNTVKYLMTRLLNEEVVHKAWGTKCYWVIQEYMYNTLINHYGLKEEGFVPEHASRFALYNFVNTATGLAFSLTRFASTTVGRSYTAKQPDADIPDKDKFVQMLNTKLRTAIYSSFKVALAERLQRQGEIHV